MEIKQYLNYYLGCDVLLCINVEGNPVYEKLTPKLLFDETGTHGEDATDIKLILRRLEDITEEECIEMYNVEYNDSNPDAAKVRLVKHWINPLQICLTPKQLHYLLQKGFWLFGNEAFDKGLIIDKKTLKQ